MKVLGHLGIDQQGRTFLLGMHPRKDLMEQLGRKHASKMYVDTKTGDCRHVGYVVGKCWVRVHAVCAWPMSRPPKEKQ